MTGNPGEPYKSPYKLTSNAHKKHRGQSSEGTKEIMAFEQGGVAGWVAPGWEPLVEQP